MSNITVKTGLKCRNGHSYVLVKIADNRRFRIYSSDLDCYSASCGIKHVDEKVLVKSVKDYIIKYGSHRQKQLLFDEWYKRVIEICHSHGGSGNLVKDAFYTDFLKGVSPEISLCGEEWVNARKAKGKSIFGSQCKT